MQMIKKMISVCLAAMMLLGCLLSASAVHSDTQRAGGSGPSVTPDDGDISIPLDPTKPTAPTEPEETEPEETEPEETEPALEIIDSGTCGSDLTWTLNDAGTLTVSGTGSMENYSIVDDYIDAPWYAYRSQIQTILIDRGVTSIGHAAFYICTNLVRVVLPEGITSIGGYAFARCSSLSSINLPVSLTEIEPVAFWKCSSLTEIMLSENLTSVGYGAFSSSGLTTVNYTGTQEQWAAISIDVDNAPLLNADITFNYVPGTAGDFTGDDKVTNQDVVYLLWHTLFPQDYPLDGNADFTGDGAVNNQDVVYLLWHTLFPDNYPL